MKTAFGSVALLTGLISGLAAAQAPAPPPKPPGNPPAAAAPPTAAPPASPGVAEPTLPTIDDPMLAPPPPAAKLLASWRQAIDVARQQSTSLRTAAARVDEARGRARQALAAALPKLSARAGVDHELLRGERRNLFTGALEPVPDPATSVAGALDLTIPVFAPSAWYGHGTARDAVDLSRLDAKETQRIVVVGIADAIVSVVTAERLSEVSRVSLASALSTFDLNKRRQALGASSMLDVLRAEQLVQDARAQVVTTDEQLLRAREALGLALGSAESYSVKTELRLESLANDARTVCRPERDVGRRPDVVATQASVGIAERQKDGIAWDFWPTIDAVSTLGVTGQRGANNEFLSWTVGGRLNWLLYDGGLRYGRHDEAAATERVAREQYTNTRRQADVEVAQAMRAVEVATVNLRVFARSREIAAETARLAKVAFMNGSGTSFDLVDTASRLRQIELDFAIKEFDLLRARVAALLALASCKV
jgi:outer membrane protein, multidrug efflux system